MQWPCFRLPARVERVEVDSAGDVGHAELHRPGPAKYSSGERTRRGHITKAGSDLTRTALIEAALSCWHVPAPNRKPADHQIRQEPGIGSAEA